MLFRKKGECARRSRLGRTEVSQAGKKGAREVRLPAGEVGEEEGHLHERKGRKEIATTQIRKARAGGRRKERITP